MRRLTREPAWIWKKRITLIPVQTNPISWSLLPEKNHFSWAWHIDLCVPACLHFVYRLYCRLTFPIPKMSSTPLVSLIFYDSSYAKPRTIFTMLTSAYYSLRFTHCNISSSECLLTALTLFVSFSHTCSVYCAYHLTFQLSIHLRVLTLLGVSSSTAEGWRLS